MSIDLSAPPVPFSFEVYPPRSEASTVALHETIRRLAAAGPALHLGDLRRRRLDGRPLARAAAVHPARDARLAARAPHVRREHLRRRERADPRVPGCRHHELPRPARRSARRHAEDASRSSATSRAPRSSSSSSTACRPSARRTPRRPSRASRVRCASSAARKVDIAVAAFPNGHPRSRHPREHIDALLAKQAAGATLAITQVFFHADDYLGFVAALARGRRDDPDPARHHADHLARAAAPRARAQRRGAARRARDRARGRAHRRGPARGRRRVRRRASPARSSRAARPASTSTRSTTTEPCSRSSATPTVLTHTIQKEAVR